MRKSAMASIAPETVLALLGKMIAGGNGAVKGILSVIGARLGRSSGGDGGDKKRNAKRIPVRLFAKAGMMSAFKS